MTGQGSPSSQGPTRQLLRWLGGAFLGAVAGLGLLAWELLVSGLANVEVALPVVRPALGAGYAIVGAVAGFLAAIAGTRGPRWATASAWSALGWLVAPTVAAVATSIGLPSLLGVLLAIAGGTGLGVFLGSIRAPAWLHLGSATWLWCSLALLAPLLTHLVAGPNLESFLAAGLAVSFGLALAAFTAAFAVEGRWPWVPLISWTALGGLLFGLLEFRPEPLPSEARLDADPIVIVVVSGLRADHTALGSSPAEPSAMPRLDRFGAEALVFEQAHASSNWSVPSLGTVLTGRLPYRHRAGWHDGDRQRHSALSPRVDTLPAALRRSGFATAAFVGDPRLRLYGLDRGFEVWEEAPERGAWPALWPLVEATGITPARWSRIASAPLVTERALSWLARQPDTGWMMLVEYADAGEDPLDIGYAATLSALDTEFGRLLDALPQDAWVVVMGDHGRSLGPSRIGAAVRPEMLRTAHGVVDGHHMYEELLHVPLALRLPTLVPGRVSAPVSLVDVAPTLLIALDHAPLARADGVPLEPVFGLPLADRVLLAQSTRWGQELQSVVAFEHKLMVTRDGRMRLYAHQADPAEVQPIQVGIEQEDLVRQLLSALPPPGGDHESDGDWWSGLGQLGSRLLGRR